VATWVGNGATTGVLLVPFGDGWLIVENVLLPIKYAGVAVAAVGVVAADLFFSRL
jgi:hypothetical protein